MDKILIYKLIKPQRNMDDGYTTPSTAREAPPPERDPCDDDDEDEEYYIPRPR